MKNKRSHDMRNLTDAIRPWSPKKAERHRREFEERYRKERAALKEGIARCNCRGCPQFMPDGDTGYGDCLLTGYWDSRLVWDKCGRHVRVECPVADELADEEECHAPPYPSHPEPREQSMNRSDYLEANDIIDALRLRDARRRDRQRWIRLKKFCRAIAHGILGLVGVSFAFAACWALLVLGFCL